MNTQGNVAIFWDFDTCTPTYKTSGYSLVENIRRVAMTFGNVTAFKAYLEIDAAQPSFSARSPELRTELQASGVSLTDCPSNSTCNTLSMMLGVDLVLYATEHAGPNTTILLISGNRGISYALSSLRFRNHRVVLICPSNTHPSLLAQVSAHIDWNLEIIGQTTMEPPPTRPSSTRLSARSRAFSTATTSFTPSESKPAFTANEHPLEDDSDDDDFYVEDPALLNGTSYRNGMGEGLRRSGSPLVPWSERPPRQSLMSRSDSRPYSPAMSFRSAKTSILTSPLAPATEIHGDTNGLEIQAINGTKSTNETGGPAAPIEPMFATSPESIIPKKPISTLSLVEQPLPTPAAQDPMVELSQAPPLSTPAISNENDGGKLANDATPTVPPAASGLSSVKLPATTGAIGSPVATHLVGAAPPPVETSTPSLAKGTSAPASKPLKSTATLFNPSSSSKSEPQQAKSIPSHWKILIDVLEERRRLLGQAQITRSDVGTALSKYKPKAVYALAGVTNFSAWITMAEKEGIVETGGIANRQWIALRPEWVSSTMLV